MPWPLDLEFTALSLSATEASLTFAGGAKLSVEQIRTRRGTAGPWVAMLDVPNQLLRSAHSRSRDAAAAEAVAIWLQWRDIIRHQP